MKETTRTALGFKVKVQEYSDINEVINASGDPGTPLDLINNGVYNTGPTAGNARATVAAVIEVFTAVARVKPVAEVKNDKGVVTTKAVKGETDEGYADRALTTYVKAQCDAAKLTDTAAKEKKAQEIASLIQAQVDLAVAAEPIRLTLPNGEKGRLAEKFVVQAANLIKQGKVTAFVARYNTDMAPATFIGDPADANRIGWAYKHWQEGQMAKIAAQAF